MKKKYGVLFLGIITIIFSMVLVNVHIEPSSPYRKVISTTSNALKPSPSPAESFQEWINDNGWYPEMPNNSYSGTMSNLYTLDGEPSIRIELRKSDPDVYGGKRSEFSEKKRDKPLEEHTYNFSTLLPKGGDEDYMNDPEGAEIIAQWQTVPDPGEKWRMPAIALYTGNAGNYILQRVWDDSAISTDEEIRKKGYITNYRLGSFLTDKGKFVHWKFHIKWGWLPSQKPLLEVYKNGVKILDLDGLPNTMNDKIGVYMTLGIFKWDWAQQDDQSILKKRVLYLNNVSIK